MVESIYRLKPLYILNNYACRVIGEHVCRANTLRRHINVMNQSNENSEYNDHCYFLSSNC